MESAINNYLYTVNTIRFIKPSKEDLSRHTPSFIISLSLSITHLPRVTLLWLLLLLELEEEDARKICSSLIISCLPAASVFDTIHSFNFI
jgi:hypothetical protein